MTRMFAALVPSQEAVAHLDEFLEVRRDAGDFRWAMPEQFHVTLAFYERVPDRALDDLVERLQRAAARRTPFRARIAGGGAFPDAARAKVLWAGLDLDDEGRTEIGRLATGCRAAANRAGVPTQGRRFTAHVTVARLGQPVEVSNWVRLLDAYRGPAWPGDTLTLVASYLGEGPRGRPRYEVVTELPLGGGRVTG